MDKPVGKIWLVTRDPGYNKLFAVSLHSFRRVVNLCLKSVTSFFSKTLYKHYSQLRSNFILCCGPKFPTFRKFTYPLIHVSFLVPEGIFTDILVLRSKISRTPLISGVKLHVQPLLQESNLCAPSLLGLKLHVLSGVKLHVKPHSQE